MQYNKIGEYEISRFGLGTKRMPTDNRSRVVHLTPEEAERITECCMEHGVNYFDTSYSNHKGEAEAFLGDYLEGQPPEKRYVATSFFETVDPRYEYVFQKQLKKLKVGCIDFYSIEGICDHSRNRDIDNGATDFLFKQREEGKIKYLGFSSELNAENLADHLSLYPWDYVRMKINYYDWFMRGGAETYAAAVEAGIPIIAHAATHVGTRNDLKPEALAVLKEANTGHSSTDMALRFVKSLEQVRCVTCNMHSTREVEANCKVFEDEVLLDSNDLELLKRVAEAQKIATGVHRKKTV